jgi:hypothetical protein
MTLATVTLNDFDYWFILIWHWGSGFLVGLAVGMTWMMRHYKKRIRHHIDQESVMK